VLRVTVLELPATWGDPRPALASVDAELEHGAPSDLVLLPEASLRGYVSPDGDFDLAPFAEPLDGPTGRALADIARRRRTNLVGPLVLAEGEHHYNAMVGFDRRGEPMFTYRKRHPWLPETWATAGPQPAPVVDIEGARVTIAICYDLHFLAEDAVEALEASDLLLFASAWVEEHDTRPAKLAELARAHRVAVANANWGPGVVHVAGQGGSAILDARGRVLVCASSSVGSARAPSRRVIRLDADIEVARATADEL